MRQDIHRQREVAMKAMTRSTKKEKPGSDFRITVIDEETMEKPKRKQHVVARGPRHTR
jgi:hypothetical protein